MKIIQQGAEAKIFLVGNKIIKDRISKSYRLPKLDNKIRKRRTKAETKLLTKASNLIPTPKPTTIQEPNKIHMPYIKGKKLSEYLDKLENKFKIAEIIGNQIAILHDNDIIHGDLTTSNMILVEKSERSSDNLTAKRARGLGITEQASRKQNQVYFIDFGLGFHSHRIEDKAVDLHLIKQALEAKHFKYYKKLYKAIIKGYKSKDKKKTLKQLEKVEARGRYKH